MFMIAEDQGDGSYLFVAGPCETWQRAKEVLDGLQSLYPRALYEIWAKCSEGWQERLVDTRQIGKRGGQSKTEAKKAASAENGKRGGRPRKMEAEGPG